MGLSRLSIANEGQKGKAKETRNESKMEGVTERKENNSNKLPTRWFGAILTQAEEVENEDTKRNEEDKTEVV